MLMACTDKLLYQLVSPVLVSPTLGYGATAPPCHEPSLHTRAHRKRKGTKGIHPSTPANVIADGRRTSAQQNPIRPLHPPPRLGTPLSLGSVCMLLSGASNRRSHCPPCSTTPPRIYTYHTANGTQGFEHSQVPPWLSLCVSTGSLVHIHLPSQASDKPQTTNVVRQQYASVRQRLACTRRASNHVVNAVTAISAART